jgi:hypothetical protein
MKRPTVEASAEERKLGELLTAGSAAAEERAKRNDRIQMNKWKPGSWK